VAQRKNDEKMNKKSKQGPFAHHSFYSQSLKLKLTSKSLPKLLPKDGPMFFIKIKTKNQINGVRGYFPSVNINHMLDNWISSSFCFSVRP
jgi:hypothetical protein